MVNTTTVGGKKNTHEHETAAAAAVSKTGKEGRLIIHSFTHSDGESEAGSTRVPRACTLRQCTV